MNMVGGVTRFDFESLYFDWLYSHVGSSNLNPAHSYKLLAEQLHKRRFTWSVPMDDNRIADACALRRKFSSIAGIELNHEDTDPQYGCSVLELILSIADRCAFESAGSNCGFDTDEWFWILMKNLAMDQYTDDVYCGERGVPEQVEHILDVFIDRRYKRDGRGGLFPLRHPNQDQREVELWYQMSAYLIEQIDFGD